MQVLLKKFFNKHLFATNIGLSFGLSGVGDILEQKMENSNRKQSRKKVTINWQRTLHMSTSFGLTSGFLCHFWYNYLDKMLPGSSIRIIIQKIAWDQVLFSPVCIVSCLLVAGKMENKSLSSLGSQTVQLGGRLYLAEWLLWPPAQFINFYYLPTKYRVLYDNIVSLVYDTYTSHVKHNVKVNEKLEEELIQSGAMPSSQHFNRVCDQDL